MASALAGYICPMSYMSKVNPDTCSYGFPGMSFVWPVLWLYVPCHTCPRLTQIHVAMDFLECPLYGQCSGYYVMCNIDYKV